MAVQLNSFGHQESLVETVTAMNQLQLALGRLCVWIPACNNVDCEAFQNLCFGRGPAFEFQRAVPEHNLHVKFNLNFLFVFLLLLGHCYYSQ